MELQKVECWLLDWKELAQNRDRRRNIENAVMNFLV